MHIESAITYSILVRGGIKGTSEYRVRGNTVIIFNSYNRDRLWIYLVAYTIDMGYGYVESCLQYSRDGVELVFLFS